MRYAWLAFEALGLFVLSTSVTAIGLFFYLLVA